jgi:PKD repeat protein
MKKIYLLASLAFTINAFAQCNASFTYTTTNSSISVTSTSTGTTSSTNYNWNCSFGPGNSSGTGSSYVFSQLYNGTYLIYLSLDSASGSCSTSQTVTISGGTNAPTCSASFTYTLGTAGSVTCTNTSPVDPLGNTSYNWNYGGGGGTMTYTFYYNGTYTLTLNANNPIDGCSTSSTQTITITNANPAAPCTDAFTYTLGATGSVNFTSLYTGTAPDITYYWDFGDGNNNSGSTTTQSYTYTYNGTYVVNLYISDAANNCDSAAVSTQTLTIINTATVPCAPTVSFYMYNPDSLHTGGDTLDIDPYYSSQVTSAVWHWGDGTSTAGLYPSHTYSVAGEYSVCATVYSSCGDSSTTCQNDSIYRLSHNSVYNNMIRINVINTAATGIKTNTQETTQVSLYPNPSAGLFTLQLNNVSTEVSKAQISITNILGEVIYSSQEQISNNSLSKEIDLQNTANGAYFMKVSMGDKTYTSKTIISK